MRARKHIARGLVTGVVVASGSYLIVPAFYLATQFEVIAGDGGLVFVPVVIIWLPLTAVEILTGASIGAVVRVKRGNEPC